MHLDSANLEDVKKIQASSIFKGITTNPTILVKENAIDKQRLIVF